MKNRCQKLLNNSKTPIHCKLPCVDSSHYEYYHKGFLHPILDLKSRWGQFPAPQNSLPYFDRIHCPIVGSPLPNLHTAKEPLRVKNALSLRYNYRQLRRYTPSENRALPHNKTTENSGIELYHR